MFTGVGRVTRAGSVVKDVAEGVANADASLACGPDVRFQLASVSKQFTAAAVLLLVDDGRVAITDPVSRWIDRCPTSWGAITIHHLLTHTAGLPHWQDLPGISLTEPMDAEDELDVFRQSQLRSSPGKAWYYSSPGYVLLAHVVQRAAAMPYRTFLDRRIFEPLELSATFVGNAGQRPNVAAGHQGGAAIKSFELDVVGMGAGDVWSTLGDMLRWYDALAEPGFLSAAARASLFQRHARLPSPVMFDDGSKTEVDGYGYGWFLGTTLGHAAVLHPGDNAGFKALNLIVPAKDVRLVMLVNDEEAEFVRAAEDMLRRALTDQ